MKRQRTNRAGSMIATAVNALALVSVARMIGPRRIARVAALATEGYLTRLRRGRSRARRDSAAASPSEEHNAPQAEGG